MHGAVADEDGNVALSEPLLEGPWGAWAARRGVIATVERVVESLEGLGHRTKIPAHRVLAVVETPFGAHPGGLYAPGLPVRSYGEDIAFWTAARTATRGDFDAWARQWVLEPTTHGAYLDRVGTDRLDWLRERTDPLSWRADADAHPVDEAEPPSAWEHAAAFGAREVLAEVRAVDADAVLAGAGVANLAAWVAVARAGEAGHKVKLTAELGHVGLHPDAGRPVHLQPPRLPRDTVVGGCLHRARHGGGRSGDPHRGLSGRRPGGPGRQPQLHDHPGGPFLVGSGGANDVASRATACVVVSLARPERLVARVGYVTSPGRRVTRIVTDRGVLRRDEGVLRIAAVPERGRDRWPSECRRWPASAGGTWTSCGRWRNSTRSPTTR